MGVEVWDEWAVRWGLGWGRAGFGMEWSMGWVGDCVSAVAGETGAYARLLRLAACRAL